MCADLSTQNSNSHATQIATALLRANGGTTAQLLLPPATGDSTDAGQLGIDAPNFQSLALSPAVFRRVRATLVEGEPPKYEMLIAAAAVDAAVGTLQVSSADELFAMAAGITVAGEFFLIEATAVAQNLGQVYLYRLALRASSTEWQAQSSS